MTSSSKREFSSPKIASTEGKRAKFARAEPSEPPQAPPVYRVVLNPADCDLDFDISGNGLHGSSLYAEGFAYCWSGVRANVGIKEGKFCFGCKVIAAQPVVMDDTPLDQQNVCRVGISRGDDAVGNLGETLHSFGFGGTGKFSNAGVFSGYGESFTVDDTIVCCVDLESKPMGSIGFSKNGRWLGVAKWFNAGPSGLGVVDSLMKNLPWISALFPHILLKNVEVQLQFSIEDGLIPPEGYRPWASCISDGKMVLGPTFQNSSDCEAIMMVGLPASGKTTWAEKWVKEHPEKRYIVLGTNMALDQMKVPGLLRKQNYGERFDRLMDRATGIFNTLMSRASNVSRNFIIDQTNVYKSARKRKLKPFMYFRKIAVVVFPRPEELKLRADRRFKEMGKEVPAEAVNEMLANCTLPMSKDMPGADEYFDEVWFPELSRVESQRCLDEMKAALRSEKVASYHSRESHYYSSPSGQNSCKSYPHSFSILLPENHGSVPGVGGNWHSSSTARRPLVGPPVSYSFQSSGRDWEQLGTYSGNSHYGLASLPRTNELSYNRSSLYSSQLPGAPPSQHQSSYFQYPGENLNKYVVNDWQNQCGPNYSESRYENYGSTNDFHQAYGVGNACSPASVSTRALLPVGGSDYHTSRMNEPNPWLTALPYSSSSFYATQPPGPAPYPLAPRPRTPMPTGPSSYGSPYGTPMPSSSQ